MAKEPAKPTRKNIMNHTPSNPSNELRFKKQILDIIKQFLPTAKIYLFGSRARKTHSLESDIDLALDCGQEIKASTMTLLREALEATTIPFCIDLVDLSQPLSSEFRKILIQEKMEWNY